MTIPIAVLAGFVPLAKDVAMGYSASGMQGAGHYLVGGVTGYDTNTGKFNVPWALSHFWLPVTAGLVVHKLAGKFGVNRALSSAGIPLFRI
jgi:hypothetical protein